MTFKVEEATQKKKLSRKWRTRNYACRKKPLKRWFLNEIFKRSSRLEEGERKRVRKSVP